MQLIAPDAVTSARFTVISAPPTFQVWPAPVVKFVVPVVVSFAPMTAEPVPNPAPAAMEMVMADEDVKTVTTAPAAIPGPEIAQPTMPAVNNATEATVVELFVVTTVATVC